jgi:hypothetical protein
MEQISIFRKDGTQTKLFTTEPFRAVSQAVQNITLLGDDNVQLTIKSSEMMDFAIGDKIIVGGDEYTIRTKANREILGEDLYSYDVVFYGVMYELMKSQYRDTDANGNSTKSTFDLTYSLADFVKVLIYNVNRDYPGIWVFDQANCPETEPRTMQFSRQNCLQALQSHCKEFGYEFRISQNGGIRTIQVGKFGNIVTPPGGNAFFEWGKENGLFTLKEQKIDDRSVITRLWVEGGQKNIRSDYRGYSDRLQLPLRRKNNKAHTLNDGTVIPADSEYIGITNDANRYIEDAELKNQIGSIEDTEYFDDIFPTRTGTVTALGADIYSFVDTAMDFDLNEKDGSGNTKWLVNGVSAKINFITGSLAGQQFELREKDGYTHSGRSFVIIKYTDERGMEFPSATSTAFRISVGDKYKITDINLPDSYVNNAEEDLWYAGYDKFIDRKQARAQYVLTFDRMYFLNTMPEDSETSVFKVGDYVPVKDERFNLEKNIRIQKLSRNLLMEHDYTLTLSDTTAISIQTQTVLDVLEHNVIIENNHLRDLAKARRSWRTTEELRSMVYDTDGYFDPENIRPNSIDTNMLTVGSKSQQFILLNTVMQANAGGQPNQFNVSSGTLAHLTIDESAIRTWSMSAISVTLSNTGGYYVFAKCSKAGSAGVYYVTQQQMKVEETSDPNNYYFLVGIIGSLQTSGNFRDFETTYGFTRINGNTITTGRIKSSGGGTTYFDLDTGVISGKITFTSGSTGYNNLSDKPDLSGIADALEKAEEAQDTADGKAKVFYSVDEPTSGMSTGDLWVTGTEIYKYTGSAWASAAKYDVTKTIINGGLISTGAIVFGDPATGGMTGSGSIRIWSGAGYNSGNKQPSTTPTFRVMSDGRVYSRNAFYVEDANGTINAGFQSVGTSDSSIRMWAGGATPSSAPFRIQHNGAVYCKNSFYVENSNGTVDGGFNSYGTNSSVFRLWIGGTSADNAYFKVDSAGNVYSPIIMAGDGTYLGSSSLTATQLVMGNLASQAASEKSIKLYGNGTYPPRLLLYTGESSVPFFEISGRKYTGGANPETFNRTMIRCAWMPWKGHMTYWGYELKAGEQKKLMFDVGSGYIYWDD